MLDTNSRWSLWDRSKASATEPANVERLPMSEGDEATQAYPIGSMGLVDLPTFGWFLMVNLHKYTRYINHSNPVCYAIRCQDDLESWKSPKAHPTCCQSKNHSTTSTSSTPSCAKTHQSRPSGWYHASTTPWITPYLQSAWEQEIQFRSTAGGGSGPRT